MRSLLLDINGDLVPFSKFKKEALKISDHQNKNWLKTEFNTAKRRAAIGAKFVKFKETAHLFPNLKWTPSRSKNPTDNHKNYWYTTLPIDHPFWASNFPGNRWNCKCGIQRTKAPVTGSNDVPATTTPPQGLDGNPAFTGQIIAKSHPVFKGLSKAEEKAAMKVVNQETSKDVRLWVKENYTDDGLQVKRKNLQTNSLHIYKGKMKTMTNKAATPFLKTYPLIIKEDIANWEYVGWANVLGGKHKNASYFTYYKTVYGDETIYVNVEVINGVEIPYAITKSIKGKKIFKEDLPKQK